MGAGQRDTPVRKEFEQRQAFQFAMSADISKMKKEHVITLSFSFFNATDYSLNLDEFEGHIGFESQDSGLLSGSIKLPKAVLVKCAPAGPLREFHFQIEQRIEDSVANDMQVGFDKYGKIKLFFYSAKLSAFLEDDAFNTVDAIDIPLWKEVHINRSTAEISVGHVVSGIGLARGKRS